MNLKTFTFRGRKFMRYEVIELDVWGNAREGFEVNAMYHTGVYITVPEDFTDRDVILALKRADAVKRGVHHKSIEIEDFSEGRMICINDARNGKPVYQLHVDFEDNTP